MNKLPKDKRDKIIGISAGTLVVIAVLWFILLGSQRQKIAEIAATTATAREKVEKARLSVAATAKVEEELAQESKKLQAREDTMASGDMYSWIIQTVNLFKVPYQVDIPQYSREVPCEAGLFAKFPYRASAFSLRGTAYFHEFGKFLADFENTFPNIRVQNLELEPVAGLVVDDREKLTFKMDLIALVKPTTP